MELLLPIVTITGLVFAAVWGIIVYLCRPSALPTTKQQTNPLVQRAFRYLQEARAGQFQNWESLLELLKKHPTLSEAIRLRDGERKQLNDQVNKLSATRLVDQLSVQQQPTFEQVRHGEDVADSVSEQVEAMRILIENWRAKKGPATAAPLMAELETYGVPQGLLSPVELGELGLN